MLGTEGDSSKQYKSHPSCSLHSNKGDKQVEISTMKETKQDMDGACSERRKAALLF